MCRVNTHMDLYSVMCVSDLAKSLKWYEVFFGRSSDEVIGEEHLWRVGGERLPRRGRA